MFCFYHYICKASIWGGYSIPKALDNYILLFYTSFNRLLIFAEIKAPHWKSYACEYAINMANMKNQY
jgi:hypothetical protein